MQLVIRCEWLTTFHFFDCVCSCRTQSVFCPVSSLQPALATSCKLHQPATDGNKAQPSNDHLAGHRLAYVAHRAARCAGLEGAKASARLGNAQVLRDSALGRGSASRHQHMPLLVQDGTDLRAGRQAGRLSTLLVTRHPWIHTTHKPQAGHAHSPSSIVHVPHAPADAAPAGPPASAAAAPAPTTPCLRHQLAAARPPTAPWPAAGPAPAGPSCHAASEQSPAASRSVRVSATYASLNCSGACVDTAPLQAGSGQPSLGRRHTLMRP